MRDRFGRTIDYLRISVTDRCNLRCAYCMPPEDSVRGGNALSPEEIAGIVREAAALGVRKLRLTGGSPSSGRTCSPCAGRCPP